MFLFLITMSCLGQKDSTKAKSAIYPLMLACLSIIILIIGVEQVGLIVDGKSKRNHL